jgi:hypothetical protein
MAGGSGEGTLATKDKRDLVGMLFGRCVYQQLGNLVLDQQVSISGE